MAGEHTIQDPNGKPQDNESILGAKVANSTQDSNTQDTQASRSKVWKQVDTMGEAMDFDAEKPHGLTKLLAVHDDLVSQVLMWKVIELRQFLLGMKLSLATLEEHSVSDYIPGPTAVRVFITEMSRYPELADGIGRLQAAAEGIPASLIKDGEEIHRAGVNRTVRMEWLQGRVEDLETEMLEQGIAPFKAKGPTFG